MKIFRRFCIVGAALGVLLWNQTKDAEETVDLPMPGSGLLVRAFTAITNEGDFHLRLGMPLPEQAVIIDSDKASCSLEITISDQHSFHIRSQIGIFNATSEYGFGKIRYYTSRESWHLSKGDYTIEVSSKHTPDEIAQRGSILSLQRITNHETERFIRRSLAWWGGVLCLVFGLGGLILCEIAQSRRSDC
jgi:hypothetical protein